MAENGPMPARNIGVSTPNLSVKGVFIIIVPPFEDILSDDINISRPGASEYCLMR